MFEEIEFRDCLEFRVAGRSLTGTVLRYGDTADLGAFRERFMPGAFSPIGDVGLNLQHDPARVLARTGNGLVVADGPRSLELRAELAGSAELELVRRGALNGFSVEFHALAQRAESGVRIIERAELTGIALVDQGAYPQSKAEVRAKSGRTLRSTIPSDTNLDCECVGVGCKVKFLTDALGEAIQEGIDSGTAWVAAHGNYQKPLASAARGTVRARMVGPDAEVEIDLPESDAGREVLAAMSASGVVVRPFVDRRESESVTDDAGVTVYTKTRIRAFIVSATDRRDGWPDPELIATPDLDDIEGRARPPQRRRLWL